jgi:hypothetical protein
MISCEILYKPHCGRNPRLVQRLAAYPTDVELTRGHLLPIPGAPPAEVQGTGLSHLREKPQRAPSRHDQTEGVGSHNAPQLPALVVAQAPQNVGITDGDLNGMIANDKFCCTRWDMLRLSWWRRPKRLRG